MLNVNEYFDGNVKSVSFQGDELASSIGVMAPGEYEFGTSPVSYTHLTLPTIYSV